MSQPISILLCALGGEGGGVLADWLIDAARYAGYPAQATSIPGVAQRTGATTYYLEVFPQSQRELGDRRPVFGLNPLPGRLDLLVSSELLESARQVSLGQTAADRTLLITAGNRVLTTQEKMQLGDGRVDDAALIQVLQQHTQACHVLDMAALTRSAGTVVSAVMLGCIAASGVLPFKREDYEAAVGQGSASQQASLRGFALAWDAMKSQRTQSRYLDAVLAPVSTSTVLQQISTPAQVASNFPPTLHTLLSLGYSRLVDYQNQRYADLYLSRMQAVLKAEQSCAIASNEVSLETARWLALWMAFDDIVRVAELKSRASRLERVRQEVKAKPDELLKIYDHFKPGVPEIAGLLPRFLAQALLRWDRQRAARGHAPWAWPIKVGTHTVMGMLALRILANLKSLRVLGQRYADEQALIDEWLSAVQAGAAQSVELGLALAQCGRLIKGYGGTHDRGRDNLLHILRHLGMGGSFASAQDRAAAVQQALQAALRDEAGTALDIALRSHGAPAREIKSQPIRWMPRKTKVGG
jgi:indolepyruvate ferredoxin oxidoreductase beta subunit